MKKRRSRRTRTKKSGNQPTFTDTGITKVSFSGQVLCNMNLNSGVASLGFFPTAINLCHRWTNVAANFEYYRIVSLEYFLVPSTTRVSNEMFGHAFLPQDSNSLGVTQFGDLLQQPAAKIFDTRMVNIQRNRITRKALLQQPTKWWSVMDTSGTPDDYVQGKLVIISSQGAVNNEVMVYFKFVCEFRSAAVGFITSPSTSSEKEVEHVKGCLCKKCIN